MMPTVVPVVPVPVSMPTVVVSNVNSVVLHRMPHMSSVVHDRMPHG